MEDKETDGELKLYPPIDDFSDEDMMGNNSSHLKAKISFGLSPIPNEKKMINIP
jgi:hypothetical protein